MVEERRRRTPGSREPEPSAAGGGERWAGYLDWLREDLVSGVLALSEEQRRTTTVASGWTPIELLNHVLHMEQRWFVWGFLGQAVDEPWGDWNVADPSAAEEGGARWAVAASVGAEELARRLRELGEWTGALLCSVPLDTPAALGGRFREDPPTLEWICFHVVAEYARHAGHLDIVVETLREG
ncbi:DUF664 domain-containing protein [Nocardioides sp. YIM 152588]|uniref:mycothiol transferase n=1 Tax=Nocardioides sp. YIM 152588 TaxID=3158259 RepID=UPI0032E5226B